MIERILIPLFPALPLVAAVVVFAARALAGRDLSRGAVAAALAAQWVAGAVLLARGWGWVKGLFTPAPEPEPEPAPKRRKRPADAPPPVEPAPPAATEPPWQPPVPGPDEPLPPAPRP